MNFFERWARKWLQRQFDETKPIMYHPGDILCPGHVMLHACDQECTANGKKAMVLVIKDPHVLVRLIDSGKPRDDYWVEIGTLTSLP